MQKNKISTFQKIVALASVVAVILSTAVTTKATVADYYDNGFFAFNGVYINRLAQPIPNVVKRGVDVSFYQGTIDWATVAQNDISFAFIRCGSYELGPDSKFKENMDGAKKNGIKRGIYIRSIATTKQFAEMEAYYVLHCARETSPEYPLVIDMEGSKLAALSPEELTGIAQAFCSVIEDAGYIPMVYSSYNWHTTKFNKNDMIKWVAQYDDVCAYEGEKWFWQCTSHGFVPGIEGRVDIDFEYDIADPTGAKKKKSEKEEATVPDTIKYSNSEKIENEKKKEEEQTESATPKKATPVSSTSDTVPKTSDKKSQELPDGTSIEVNDITEENGWTKK